MAKGDEKRANERREEMYADIGRKREQFERPSALESEMTAAGSGYADDYRKAADRSFQDYGDIQGLTREWRDKSITPTVAAINARAPKPFTYQSVGYERDPSTFGRAISGYTDFADTGGYSSDDIRDLRARGISPIRSVYANAMQGIDRQRSLQGGYAPNYIAAQAKMSRDLSQGISDATQNVNATLADAIRQGKLAGLSGLTGIGGQEGGWNMQSQLANQGADLNAQQMTEASLAAHDQRKLAAQDLLGRSIGMERDLYGTTPGMASHFGNQVGQSYNQRANMEQMRNQFGLGLIDQQMRTLQPIDTGGTPWWKTALQVAGTAAPYVAMAASARDTKTDLQPVYGYNSPIYSGLNSISSSIKKKEGIKPITDKEVTEKLKNLSLFKWRYKGDKTTHMGPMAEEFQEAFGVGDGKTLHLADVMGVTLAAARHQASKA